MSRLSETQTAVLIFLIIAFNHFPVEFHFPILNEILSSAHNFLVNFSYSLSEKETKLTLVMYRTAGRGCRLWSFSRVGSTVGFPQPHPAPRGQAGSWVRLLGFIRVEVLPGKYGEWGR